MSPRLRWTVLAFISALWLLSLALPAVEVSGTSVRGHVLLARGWRATDAGVLAWYANPLFVAAFCASLLSRHRTAGVLSSLSLLLALTSFASEELARARGVAVPAVAFASGFYVWLAASSMLAVWSWMLAAQASRFGARTSAVSPDNRD